MKTKCMLRTVVVCALMALVSLSLVGCGDKGDDGKPYLKFNWDDTVLSYTDTIPGTPATITINTYYQTEAGTYTFEYVHGNNADIVWTGTVTLVKGKEGEDGGLFSDGDDGDDVFYQLYLYAFIGPQLSDYGTSRLKGIDDGPAAQEVAPVQQIVRNGWIITLEVEKQIKK